LKFPTILGFAEPRFEQFSPSQHRSTWDESTSPKPLPLTVADVPAWPEVGDTEIDAAAAGGAVVTWITRRERTRTRVSVAAIARLRRIARSSTDNPR